VRVSLSRPARNAAGLSRARPRGTARAALISLIVTAGGIASAAAPASAAATATVSRTIKLNAQSDGVAFLPADSNGVASPRLIYLAKGTYTWEYSFTGAGTTISDRRQISVAAGWYNWICNIDGTGAAAPGADNYTTQCLLDPTNTNLAIATLPGSSAGFDLFDIPPGNYNWVSNLIPNF